MIITDPLYGEYEVEQVLADLIESQAVQRLKGIHQGGASYLVNERWNVTRYDHSIGVMLLVRKLGASIEEQIAALLHDISHTAFSHVVDVVLDYHEEDYHEQIFHSVIKESQIPTILSEYGYCYQELLMDDSKWTLLEQPAPDLCADRVDYTLRDMYEYGHISLEEVQMFLDDLIVVDGKMTLQTIEVAEWFVETYYKEVIDFFMDPLNLYGYDTLAKTLQLALEKNLLNKKDFLREDNQIISQLQSVNDQDIQRLLAKIHPNVVVTEDPVNYDIHRKNKVRLIDPSIRHENAIRNVSLLSPKVRELNDIAHKKATRGVYVKVIST